jgi:hypothetical protein
MKGTIIHLIEDFEFSKLTYEAVNIFPQIIFQGNKSIELLKLLYDLYYHHRKAKEYVEWIAKEELKKIGTR